ncbi:tetratricopeptide repeat protein [Kroppenstedtia pulmonis]|uniref:Tetratricopeptide repeat protein n=2 Tax=Kroppenstedtia pulmonis TaxID=1380685 RepID=A0A7D3XIP6_9BACL|nr:tetratricopeptide repeat protein [Kroppenstedtia pulmonis]
MEGILSILFIMFDLWIVLGSVHMSNKDWQKAESCFHTALCLKNTPLNEKRLTTAYSRLGVLYMARGQANQALEVIEKAINNAKTYNDAPRLCSSLQIMGDLYRLKGEDERSLQYYQQIIELAKKYKYKKKEYQALNRLVQRWEGINKRQLQKNLINEYIEQSN